ncbi:Crp/Fnr family transcriptional regulator [Streptomyces radicis]|uniref:Crp/Fnr family transcriptional regulator n=1 Tax=Streptomyces radicis TaxID=1750517 RepID=A0A3A9WFQ9_9ACTN|nr:Crp/Fnr family transcriptional regulator [Streptomyces radicis]RKN11629.1 Crp/Fnr family transcriptional regulator [Streptomyces radicis]RKN26827.1 Crp/Fnr family transcriptional regulator [Streptomyces radicis]
MSGIEWPGPTFLGRLGQDSLKDLMDIGVLFHYPQHRALLRQGDNSRHVLLILDGIVKVVTTSENGYDMLTAIRVRGDLVGEMAAFEDRPRSSSVIAIRPVTAHLIQWPQLDAFLSRHPDARREILRMQSTRLRWANQRRLDFGAYEAPTRFARVLGELTQTYGHPVDGASGKSRKLGVTITQAELASLAGIALPTAQKTLAELSRRGVVERGRRTLVIKDVPQLMRIAKLVD